MNVEKGYVSPTLRAEMGGHAPIIYIIDEKMGQYVWEQQEVIIHERVCD